MSLYLDMKSVWNSMKTGEAITSIEMMNKVGGDRKDFKAIGAFMSRLKSSGVAVKGDGRPAPYKKLSDFRQSSRGRKPLEETEFTPLEVGKGVMAFVRDMQKHLDSKAEMVSSLKRKIDQLTLENNRLSQELEREKNRVEIINRKHDGKTMRFSVART